MPPGIGNAARAIRDSQDSPGGSQGAGRPVFALEKYFFPLKDRASISYIGAACTAEICAKSRENVGFRGAEKAY